VFALTGVRHTSYFPRRSSNLSVILRKRSADAGPPKLTTVNNQTVRVAAVDLGATSGRVCAVTVGPNQLDLAEVARFVDPTVMVPNSAGGYTLTLDVLAIWAGIVDGLQLMAAEGPVDGIGVDAWAVDYGLLDDDGSLIANPTNYRDTRANGISDKLFAESGVDFTELYRRTGIQFLPFNTVFQLAAEKADNPTRFNNANQFLMLPDLFNYWLCGATETARVTEITNASSTALVNPVTRDWDYELIDKLAYPRNVFPNIVEAGTIIGTAAGVPFSGAEQVPVIAVGSHDTASAIVAVPMVNDVETSAYISSGTWSLVGLELPEPVLTDEAREINATNELGIDGTVRFLRNTMGLWLLSQSQEQWKSEGIDIPLSELLAQAAQIPANQWLIDADSSEFLAPGTMSTRIANAAAMPSTEESETPAAPPVETKGMKPKPETPAEITRCIMDSLATAYAKSVRELSAAAGRQVETIYIVGGGSQNTLLCQLTADATGCKVVAGPVEAAALGNALVQARTLGVIEGGLPQIRDLVRRTQTLTEYYPNSVG